MNQTCVLKLCLQSTA